ncbi:MAG: DUF5706 domain-containing protein [Chitinophagales bacterium]|nr:DUF5706 domain-containing protein [Chitinophagales bacterium]
MKKQSPILEKASQFTFAHIRDHVPANYIYHNFTHTAGVVESAAEIAEGLDISKEDTELVLLAAWFHDTGFSDIYYGHENVSKEIAERFLKENFYPEDKIQKVLGCIEATRYPQNPQTLLEQIVCDADLSGLASKKYIEKSNFLRLEREFVDSVKLNDVVWYKSEIEFFSNHRYQTSNAHLEYDKNKIKHILELKDLLNEAEEKIEKENKKKDQKITEKTEKEKKPERGIETMFRVTMSNHMNLSKMADDKANFLLTINGIILSFAIGNLLSKFDTSTNAFLIIPTAILMITCLLCIIFAVLATRPKIDEGKSSKDDIDKKEANLLFFGNFYGMKLEDFKWGINQIMEDREYLYGSLIKDLYFLGKVLGKKYKLMRIAYTLFMWGIIISVAAYAVSYAYYFYYLGQPTTIISPTLGY